MFNIENYRTNNFINSNKLKEIVSGKCYIYTIPIKYRYRPDLISWDLYKDVKMANLISIINNIDNSPEGYYTGREILVIKPEHKDLV